MKSTTVQVLGHCFAEMWIFIWGFHALVTQPTRPTPVLSGAIETEPDQGTAHIFREARRQTKTRNDWLARAVTSRARTPEHVTFLAVTRHGARHLSSIHVNGFVLWKKKKTKNFITRTTTGTKVTRVHTCSCFRGSREAELPGVPVQHRGQRRAQRHRVAVRGAEVNTPNEPVAPDPVWTENKLSEWNRKGLVRGCSWSDAQAPILLQW